MTCSAELRLGLLGIGLGLALASSVRAEPGVRLIDTPYIAPAGTISAYGAFDPDHTSVTDETSGTAVGFTTEKLQLGGAYGLTDRFTAGLQYGFPVAGDNADQRRFQGPLAAYAMFSILHDDTLVLAATADFTADLCGENNLTGGCAITSAIHAGVGVRFKLARQLALYSGDPIGPGPVGHQLAISLSSGGPVTLDIPVGGELQAGAQLFAYLQTDLLRFNLANAGGDAVDVIGSRALGVPLAAGAFYAVNERLHLGFQVAFADLVHAGDAYDLGVLVRWYQ
jgi:hypothetical protein